MATLIKSYPFILSTSLSVVVASLIGSIVSSFIGGGMGLLILTLIFLPVIAFFTFIGSLLVTSFLSIFIKNCTYRRYYYWIAVSLALIRPIFSTIMNSRVTNQPEN